MKTERRESGLRDDPTAAAELEAVLATLPPEVSARVRQLVARGLRHETRLQQLQQTVSALSRSLDEEEIIEEFARGAQGAVRCDGVLVARVDLDRALVEVVHHVVGDAERPTRAFPLSAGPITEAARSGSPVLVAPYDPSTALGAVDDVVAGEPACAVLAVPIMHGRRLLGVVAMHDTRLDAFDADAAEVLSTLARHAAGALSNARLFADSERERRQSEAMSEIARAVGESLKMGEVLRLILRHAMALLQAEGAIVALRAGDYLNVVSALGIADVFAGIHMPLTGSLSGRVATDGVALVTNDTSTDPDAHRQMLRLVQVQRSVIVPLVTARGIIGVLSVYNRPAEFTTDDARVLQRLADQVAVAIVNARLYEEVRDATREWSAAFESIGVGMCVVDEGGKITRFNSRALQLTAAESSRTIVGHPFYQTILGVQPDRNEDPLAGAIHEGVQSRTVCEGRGGRWLEIMAVPHPNGGAIVTFDDVSAERAVWDRNRRIVDATADALCTIDREGRVIFSNPAARQLFQRDDLTGARWSDLVVHEMADEARAHAQLAMEDAPQSREYIVQRGDGERRVVMAALAPVKEGEHVSMVVASLHDVTDARRAGDVVAHSESRYRSLFDGVGDAALTLNASAAITSANPATCRLLDATADEVLGRSLYPFIATDDVERVTTFLRDALEGEPRRWEGSVVRRNGARRIVSVVATPVRQGHSITGLLLIARDVTREREHERAIDRGDARYVHLLESATDAICTLDERGNFTSVNRAFEAATGRGRDAVNGHHFGEMLDPRDREAMWQVFVATLHGQRGGRDVRFLDSLGRSRWGALRASPLIEDGTVTGVLVTVHDVTHERRLLDEVIRREKLASLGQLVGGVAHELNNPLSAVLAFSELLLETSAASAHDREALATIHHEARRASRIVRNLLDIARQHPAQRAELQLTDVITSALGVRDYALRVNGVEIEAQLPRDLPTTMGDAARLQQAMLHLIARAEQSFREWQGAKRLSVRASRVADVLVMEMQYTGPGISAMELERLFSADNLLREGIDLAGIGLAVAADIIREHNGRIHVDSMPGEGVTFVVELPIVTATASAGAEPMDDRGEREAGALDVLVVDDEPSIRGVLVRTLEALGHRVGVASDGEEASAALQSRHYDRILLDVRMPRRGGDALYHELRTRRPDLVPRIIFVTGDGANEGTQLLLRESGRLAIHKPFTLDDVRSAITEPLRAG
ncbi:MAG: PAS domain S-box protein [Gemmatimonadaceae bacterium]